jgi:hypothetical protein
MQITIISNDNSINRMQLAVFTVWIAAIIVGSVCAVPTAEVNRI